MSAADFAFNEPGLARAQTSAARGLEQRVVVWLAPYFGMRGGHLLRSSTLANLTANWVAWAGPLRLFGRPTAGIADPELVVERVAAAASGVHRGDGGE